MDDRKSMPETLQQFRDCASTEHELWNLTELLLTDLEMSRKENTCLREQLKDLFNKNESVSHFYLDVEVKNSKLKEEIKTIKFRLNAQKLQFQSELSEIKSTYETKLKISEEEYKKLQQILNKKEREFFEELQLAQATAAYEFEKIEKKLKWQLSEANKQLYEKNLINSKLRTQLENIEYPQNKPENNSMKAIPLLRNKEILSTDIDISEFESLKRSDALEIANNTPLRTYEPLQVEYSSIERKCEKQTPPLFKGKSRFLKNTGDQKTGNARIGIKSNLPPLIPCSRAVPANQKKRRLHDPEDLSYLVDLIPTEDN